jgi:hypothetical protein
MPTALQAGTDADLYDFYEENIPSSSFERLGCESLGDCDTVITVPDGGERYTISVEPVAVGTFTLDIERIQGTTTIEKVSWVGVPITSGSTARTTVSGYSGYENQGTPLPSDQSGRSAPAGTAVQSLASSTSSLDLDWNGDGVIDASSTPETASDQTSNAPYGTGSGEATSSGADLLEKMCQVVLPK